MGRNLEKKKKKTFPNFQDPLETNFLDNPGNPELPEHQRLPPRNTRVLCNVICNEGNTAVSPQGENPELLSSLCRLAEFMGLRKPDSLGITSTCLLFGTLWHAHCLPSTWKAISQSIMSQFGCLPIPSMWALRSVCHCCFYNTERKKKKDFEICFWSRTLDCHFLHNNQRQLHSNTDLVSFEGNHWNMA